MAKLAAEERSPRLTGRGRIEAGEDSAARSGGAASRLHGSPAVAELKRVVERRLGRAGRVSPRLTGRGRIEAHLPPGRRVEAPRRLHGSPAVAELKRPALGAPGLG